MPRDHLLSVLIAARDGLSRAIAVLREPSKRRGRPPKLPPEARIGATLALAQQERELIRQALEAAGGNQSQAARILRIGRDALRYELKKHNLETAVVIRRATRGPGA